MEASGRIGRPGIERVLQQLVDLRPLLDHEVDELETPAEFFESVVTKLKFSERFQQTEKLSLKFPETTPVVGVGVVDRKRVAVRKFFGQKWSLFDRIPGRLFPDSEKFGKVVSAFRKKPKNLFLVFVVRLVQDLDEVQVESGGLGRVEEVFQGAEEDDPLPVEVQVFAKFCCFGKLES